MPIWFGLTWSEMRDETGDDQMLPLGHALSVFLPGWNAWQAWRHFRAIDLLVSKVDPRKRIDATSGAIGVVIWWLTFTHYSSDPLFLVLDGVELLAGAMVVVYGQRGLNAYWAAAHGAEEHFGERDLVALTVAAVYLVVTVVGFLTPGS